jgi:hypothetical protein
MKAWADMLVDQPVTISDDYGNMVLSLGLGQPHLDPSVDGAHSTTAASGGGRSSTVFECSQGILLHLRLTHLQVAPHV